MDLSNRALLDASQLLNELDKVDKRLGETQKILGTAAAVKIDNAEALAALEQVRREAGATAKAANITVKLRGQATVDAPIAPVAGAPTVTPAAAAPLPNTGPAADAAAALAARIKEISAAVAIARNDFISLGNSADVTDEQVNEVVTTMTRLQREMTELRPLAAATFGAASKEARSLSTSAAQAQRTVAGVRGEMSRLGLASQVKLGIENANFNVQGQVNGIRGLALSTDSARISQQLFNKTLEKFGKDATVAEESVKRLSTNLKISEDTAREGLRQLIRKGYDLVDAERALTLAASSAVAARKTATDGVQAYTDAVNQELSAALNGIGISENLSTFYQKEAKARGTTVDALDRQAKAQAELTLLESAAADEADALGDAYSGVAGGLADAELATERAGRAFGESFGPVVVNAASIAARFLEAVAALPDPIQNTIATVALIGVGFALIATPIINSIRLFKEAGEVVGNLKTEGARGELRELSDIATNTAESLERVTAAAVAASEAPAPVPGGEGGAEAVAAAAPERAAVNEAAAAEGFEEAGAAAEKSGGKVKAFAEKAQLARDSLSGVSQSGTAAFESFKSLGTAAAGLSGGGVAGLFAFGQAAVDAATSATEAVTGAREAFDALRPGKKEAEAAQAAAEGAGAAAEAAGAAAEGAGRQADRAAEPLARAARAGAGDLVGDVAGGAAAGAAVAGGFWAKVTGGIKSVGQAAATVLKPVQTLLTNLVKTPLGKAGLLGAAALAGTEVGKLLGNLKDVNGRTLNENVQSETLKVFYGYSKEEVADLRASDDALKAFNDEMSRTADIRKQLTKIKDTAYVTAVRRDLLATQKLREEEARLATFRQIGTAAQVSESAARVKALTEAQRYTNQTAQAEKRRYDAVNKQRELDKADEPKLEKLRAQRAALAREAVELKITAKPTDFARDFAQIALKFKDARAELEKQLKGEKNITVRVEIQTTLKALDRAQEREQAAAVARTLKDEREKVLENERTLQAARVDLMKDGAAKRRAEAAAETANVKAEYDKQIIEAKANAQAAGKGTAAGRDFTQLVTELQGQRRAAVANVQAELTRDLGEIQKEAGAAAARLRAQAAEQEATLRAAQTNATRDEADARVRAVEGVYAAEAAAAQGSAAERLRVEQRFAPALLAVRVASVEASAAAERTQARSGYDAALRAAEALGAGEAAAREAAGVDLNSKLRVIEMDRVTQLRAAEQDRTEALRTARRDAAAEQLDVELAALDKVTGAELGALELRLRARREVAQRANDGGVADALDAALERVENLKLGRIEALNAGLKDAAASAARLAREAAALGAKVAADGGSATAARQVALSEAASPYNNLLEQAREARVKVQAELDGVASLTPEQAAKAAATFARLNNTVQVLNGQRNAALLLAGQRFDEQRAEQAERAALDEARLRAAATNDTAALDAALARYEAYWERREAVARSRGQTEAAVTAAQAAAGARSEIAGNAEQLRAAARDALAADRSALEVRVELARTDAELLAYRREGAVLASDAARAAADEVERLRRSGASQVVVAQAVATAVTAERDARVALRAVGETELTQAQERLDVQEAMERAAFAQAAQAQALAGVEASRLETAALELRSAERLLALAQRRAAAAQAGSEAEQRAAQTQAAQAAQRVAEQRAEQVRAAQEQVKAAQEAQQAAREQAAEARKNAEGVGRRTVENLRALELEAAQYSKIRLATDEAAEARAGYARSVELDGAVVERFAATLERAKAAQAELDGIPAGQRTGRRVAELERMAAEVTPALAAQAETATSRLTDSIKRQRDAVAALASAYREQVAAAQGIQDATVGLATLLDAKSTRGVNVLTERRRAAEQELRDALTSGDVARIDAAGKAYTSAFSELRREVERLKGEGVDVAGYEERSAQAVLGLLDSQSARVAGLVRSGRDAARQLEEQARAQATAQAEAARRAQAVTGSGEQFGRTLGDTVGAPLLDAGRTVAAEIARATEAVRVKADEASFRQVGEVVGDAIAAKVAGGAAALRGGPAAGGKPGEAGAAAGPVSRTLSQTFNTTINAQEVDARNLLNMLENEARRRADSLGGC